jgi:predicted metal-dependent enzyme (double-stranded beta helix superfamily)
MEGRREMPTTDRHDPLDPIAPLRHFVVVMTRLVEHTQDERALLREGRRHLSELLADDRWLPVSCASANAGEYRQYLLHCDPLERFSVVSFVWGPGACTPIHDHTVWGLVGVLRGAEHCMEYAPQGDAQVRASGREHVMQAGMIEAVSPTLGDWHVVSNAAPDAPSVSIHVYGGNIGAVKRHRFDEAQGKLLDFVSGYSSDTTPNLWDLSAPARVTG